LRLPIAALVGLFLFDEVPDGWTIAGGLVIAGASAYIARRDAMARTARVPRNPTV
jgi:drug/metabolite transporter (DMT)-like permease